MGVWLGVSGMLALSAYGQFGAVETVLKSPPEQASRIIRLMEVDNARMLLRYAAGVVNANTFEIWEDIQFALGLLIVMVMFLGTSTRVLAAVPLVMTLLVLFVHWKITPELAWLGRSLEFSPPTFDAEARRQFWRLHRIYGILDTVKCLLGLGLTVFVMLQKSAKVVRRRHHHEHGLEGAMNRQATSR